MTALKHSKNCGIIEGELWETILCDTYAVSSHGRIMRTAGNGKAAYAGMILSNYINAHGYPSIDLYRDGKRHKGRVHRLVAAAFIGPCPDGKQVNHKDGVKTNSHVSNLEYVTGSENCRHSWATGLQKAPQVKHKPHPQVDEMKMCRESGMTYRQIAEKFNTNHTTARRSVLGLRRVKSLETI